MATLLANANLAAAGAEAKPPPPPFEVWYKQARSKKVRNPPGTHCLILPRSCASWGNSTHVLYFLK